MTTPLSKDEVTAFVGKKADYYWTRWTPLIQGQNWTAFNWAAFFFTGWWLAYRKMYGAALMCFAIMLAAIFLAPKEIGDRSTEELQSSLGLIVGLFCGAYGNRWYWSRATKVITDVRSQASSADDLTTAISRRGRTSMGAAIGFFAVFVALILLASK